jgi:hypothetical protein
VRTTTRILAVTLAGALSLGTAASAASAEGGASTTAQSTTPPTTAHVESTTAASAPSTTVHHDQPATPPPPPPNPTTAHDTAPPVPTTKAAAGPTGLDRLIALVDTYIAQVEGSGIEAGLKARLLGRLQEVRAKAVAGKADTGALQSLINDLNAALNRPSGDASAPTTATTSTESHGGKPLPAPPANAPLDQAAQAHLLDLAEAKVNASDLSAADKQVLLDAIAGLRTKLEAGPLTGEVLGMTLGQIRDALEKNHPGGPDTSGAPKTGSPHDRAADALAREIERIKHSDLPDDVKAKIVASLTSAEDQLGDAATAAKDIKDKLVEHQMKRIEEIRTKLAAAIERELARADAAAGVPGVDVAKLAQAKATLGDAKDKLAMATTVADLKAVWLNVRDAHVLIKAARPASAAPTVPPSTVPPTTESPETVPSTTEVPSTTP